MKAAHNVDMAKVSRKPGHQAPTHALELGLSPLPAIKSAMNTTLVPILGFKDHGQWPLAMTKVTKKPGHKTLYSQSDG